MVKMDPPEWVPPGTNYHKQGPPGSYFTAKYGLSLRKFGPPL